jgi:pimeloyl-ACP methyl ester carboxylesterase
MKPFVAFRCCLVTLSFAWPVLRPAPSNADEEKGQVIRTVAKAVVHEAKDHRFRRWLRERVWNEKDEARYGLQLDEGWQQAAAKSSDLPLVLIVHGYNSTPARNAAVMEPIRAADYPTGAFAYPNDWDIADSAALMSRQLKEFAKDHPGQKIALVTHSMGGLVARAVIENSDLDPGDVTRLVMIAPPSQGTLLAQFAVATDLWEHWIARHEGGGWARWRDSVIDGLGEAADDLTPDSPFLTELNARPRNPHVHYSLFLGTGASVSEDEMNWMREAIKKTGGHFPGLRSGAGKLDAMLADMDELIDGKGDGVVALKRGRLTGVDDVVILPFGHLSCTGKPDREAVKQLQVELLARLK